MIIAGPCSAETQEQVLNTARRLSQIGVKVFRAGIWKPRTHPGCFEGVGPEGLKWLGKVKTSFGMKVCTEVANARHVEDCLKAGIDMLWIGARTTANPFLVQEIAEALSGTDIPVLVKNPVSPDPELWIGAIERLLACGVSKIGVIHRGFSSVEELKYRNDPKWQIAVEFRTSHPEIPFFCDPSHIAGDKALVREIAQRALDLGLDGLMIESHCQPVMALSDASQQLTPDELSVLLSELVVRNEDSDSSAYKDNIEQLRSRIDLTDEQILRLLASRMHLCRQIGEYKRANNISILQTSRWEKVLSSVVAKGKELGLSEDFVMQIFNTIHETSVQIQDEILSDSSDKI